MRTCKLCNGPIACTDAGKSRSTCISPRAKPPGSCWLNDTRSLKALCARSLPARPGHSLEARSAALRLVGQVIDKSELHLRSVLAQLTPVQRYELMHHAVPELRTKLSPLLVELDLPIQPPPRPALVPTDISDILRQGLLQYRDRLQRRLETVMKRGGSRRPRYVQQLLNTPIRLARYLDKNGIKTWDGMRKRDVVAFMAENPKVTPRQLSRLLRALSEDAPFAERRGRYVRGRGAVRPIPLQKVLPPNELDEFLEGVRKKCSSPEYLGAWLVAKMGMSATAVYRLTADRLKVDESGRVVIRPAEAWVVLPKGIGRLFSELADKTAPGWRKRNGADYRFVKLFGQTLPTLNKFRERVLNRDACRLRASAVYAALISGHLDRVTVHTTMGVSHMTIASIERHLSVDVHRKLDPALVHARNMLLIGE